MLSLPLCYLVVCWVLVVVAVTSCRLQLIPSGLLLTPGGLLFIAGGVLCIAEPLQKSWRSSVLGLGIKNEAWRRENCTVYAEGGQLCNKQMNQRREASHPQNSTAPCLQMLNVWQRQLYNQQFC